MNWLTRVMLALLRHSEPMLPAEHRAWARGLRAEAGASAFAAGYLIVLLLSPLAGCGLGSWTGRAAGRLGPGPL